MATEIRYCRPVAPPSRVVDCMRAAVIERPDNHAQGLVALDYEPPVAVQAAAVTKKLWKPGREIRVRYLGGSKLSRQIADGAVTEWERRVNLRFTPVRNGPSEIRVAFERGRGSWSYLGTDALVIPADQPTMNLGWDDPATALHEFGHALGLIHEHSNPDGNIPWDVEAVLRDYSGPPNSWDRQTILANVLTVYDRRVLTNAGFDPKSIMLYPIPEAHVTDKSRAVGWNRTLSPGDAVLVAKLYPRDALVDRGREALGRLTRIQGAVHQGDAHKETDIMFSRLKRAVVARQIADFLGAVPGAIRNHLNTAELARIVAAALLSGGGIWGALEALAKSLPEWVAPADVGFATGIFILILEIGRRLGHGDEVEPSDAT